MGKKLLVADDSVTIQKVIKLALSSEGYDILAVSNGRDAIRAVTEERPDVVLIDVSLPGANAFEVKKAMNSNPALSHVGVVLLASAFEKVDEAQVQEYRFDGRLIKPFDPSHLRKAVSELMNRRSGVSNAPSIPKVETPQKIEVSLDDAPIAPIEDFAPPQIVLAAPVDFNNDETDLPPVQDMMPTLNTPPPIERANEEEFRVDISKLQEEANKLSAGPPPVPTVQMEQDEEEVEENSNKNLENDIRNLTESTIKLSGLDESQWNVDDSRKMKSPGTPPKISISEGIDRTREMERPGRPMITPPARPIDGGGSTFPIRSAVGTASANARQNIVSGRDFSKPKDETVSTTTSASASPMTRAEMEDMIRREISAAIERLAKDTVPSMAENLIRKEIEKVLSE